MPIRLNLLAEAQELEEQRRRDPVKRVIIVGAVCVGLILFWSAFLVARTIVVRGDVHRLEGNLNSRTNEYRQIIENQKILGQDLQKLQALHRLATNRFLMGTLLDALERTTVDNVQLLHLKIDQNYKVTAVGKPKGHAPPKPATATERITLTLSAKDSSPHPGDGVNRFQEALSSSPYFKAALGKSGGFHLVSLGQPQIDPAGNSFILFNLETRFPDKVR